jgi:hypothetical protein
MEAREVTLRGPARQENGPKRRSPPPELPGWQVHRPHPERNPSSRILPPTLGAFRRCADLSAWPTESASQFIHETSSTRRRLCSSRAGGSALRAPQLLLRCVARFSSKSNCSRVLMLGIEAHHIEIAHRMEIAHRIEIAHGRSSPPNISHSQWLSTVRGTRQSAR